MQVDCNVRLVARTPDGLITGVRHLKNDLTSDGRNWIMRRLFASSAPTALTGTNARCLVGFSGSVADLTIRSGQTDQMVVAPTSTPSGGRGLWTFTDSTVPNSGDVNEVTLMAGSATTIARVTVSPAESVVQGGSLTIEWTLSFSTSTGSFRTSNYSTHSIYGNVYNAVVAMIAGISNIGYRWNKARLEIVNTGVQDPLAGSGFGYNDAERNGSSPAANVWRSISAAPVVAGSVATFTVTSGLSLNYAYSHAILRFGHPGDGNGNGTGSNATFTIAIVALDGTDTNPSNLADGTELSGSKTITLANA